MLLEHTARASMHLIIWRCTEVPRLVFCTLRFRLWMIPSNLVKSAEQSDLQETFYGDAAREVYGQKLIAYGRQYLTT